MACIERLLEKGAAVNVTDNDGYAALRWATCGGHGYESEEAEALLKAHGASL